jgi:glycosyltransferase involved in cell wall biosynthesis
MRIFLNALGATCASGWTYLRNVIPHLSDRADVQITLLVKRQLRQELAESSNISILEIDSPASVARRFWFEQSSLPGLIRKSGADVLISAGNFALRNSPVPQILLSGNSLYTSSDFSRDLYSRREYALWLDNRVKAYFARRSIHWADATVAPSRNFAEDLHRWTGKEIVYIHHGFDHEVFFGDPAPLPDPVQQKLDSAPDALRLLFVSHYNYYRNFETLLQALPILRDSLGPRKVRLFLTCQLHSENNPGSYRAETAASLVERLGIREELVELGTIPYKLLHHAYKVCHVYVTPAYAETFAHPLVEAMASGLPVVASDLPVHREICGEAALYFPRFSPESLARQLIAAANSRTQYDEMKAKAQVRASQFSWARHVQEIILLAERTRRQPVTRSLITPVDSGTAHAACPPFAKVTARQAAIVSTHREA